MSELRNVPMDEKTEILKELYPTFEEDFQERYNSIAPQPDDYSYFNFLDWLDSQKPLDEVSQTVLNDRWELYE